MTPYTTGGCDTQRQVRSATAAAAVIELPKKATADEKRKMTT